MLNKPVDGQVYVRVNYNAPYKLIIGKNGTHYQFIPPGTERLWYPGDDWEWLLDPEYYQLDEVSQVRKIMSKYE